MVIFLGIGKSLGFFFPQLNIMFIGGSRWGFPRRHQVESFPSTSHRRDGDLAGALSNVGPQR